MMPQTQFAEIGLRQRFTINIRRLAIGDVYEHGGVWVRRVNRHKYQITYWCGKEVIEVASDTAKSRIRAERSAFKERVNFEFNTALSQADKIRAVQDSVIDRVVELAGTVPIYQTIMFDQAELRAA